MKLLYLFGLYLDASSGTPIIDSDLARIEKSANMAKLRTRTEVSQLLDNFYNCALTCTLTHKEVKFRWDDAHEEELMHLKPKFSTIELLAPHDPIKQLCAITDSSYMELAFLFLSRKMIVIGP